jgi:hypothetical protein
VVILHFPLFDRNTLSNFATFSFFSDYFHCSIFLHCSIHLAIHNPSPAAAMGFFCCRKKAQAAPPTPESPKSLKIPKKSIPRSQASKKNIEQFYREGKELRRAEQEEQERNNLRAALRQEYDRDEFEYDEDMQDIRLPRISTSRTGSISRGSVPRSSNDQTVVDSTYRHR